MQVRSIVVASAVVLMALVIAACDGGSDSSGGGGDGGGGGGDDSPCVKAGRLACEKACACGTAPECKTGFRNAFGSFATFTWSDKGDCEGNYVTSRCKNGGKAGVDYAACLSATQSTACETGVFVLPDSCEAPRDGG